jgi:hypothetical protein
MNVLTDIRMIYLGQEADFWRSHGVFFGEEELEVEYAVYIDRRERE